MGADSYDYMLTYEAITIDPRILRDVPGDTTLDNMGVDKNVYVEPAIWTIEWARRHYRYPVTRSN